MIMLNLLFKSLMMMVMSKGQESNGVKSNSAVTTLCILSKRSYTAIHIFSESPEDIFPSNHQQYLV